MGISDFAFSLIDSQGISHSITPTSWRIHDFFMAPSRMNMKVDYDESEWGGDFAGKIVVADGADRPFLGYIEEIEEPLVNPSDSKNIVCYSLHNLLRDRLLTHRFYSQTWSMLEGLNDALGTMGLLNDANHSMPLGIWNLEPLVPHTWFCYITPGELPTPTIYRDNVPLTPAADVASLLEDQYYQGDIQLWIRTPYFIPEDYQIQASSPSAPFRDTHIRLAPTHWNGYNDDGQAIPSTCGPNIQETAFDFLQRLISTALLEYRFFNQPNNTTYLCFARNVGHIGSAFRTYDSSKVINLKRITLPDRGYKQYTYHTADSNKTCWQPEYGGGYDGYFWKEKRITGFRMTPTQLEYACRVNFQQRSAAKAYALSVAYDKDVGIGDLVHVNTSRVNIWYRVLEKITDSRDKGKMTLILYDWRTQ